jgi:uncharacterized protein YyaL (SSP411 family)
MELRNRLCQQGSPYLAQRAQDPIAWQEWDPATLSLARQLDRPLFLSVGFQNCHWCQQMGREAFRAPELAQILNDLFLPVLIDRQQHPELDRQLLDLAGVVHHLAGGKGPLGWPLHLVLTPDLEPIFAFTTLPTSSSQGQIGIVPLLTRLGQAWHNGQRQEMERVGSEVVQAIQSSLAERESGEQVASRLDLEHHLEAVLRDCDPVHGGRFGAPKFPLPHLLQYLLYAGELHADARPWMQLRTSLWQIVHGGLQDHFDGGFFRYCSDAGWRSPRFERMLLDNALLLQVMAKSLCAIQEPWLPAAVEYTAQFLLRRLRKPNHLFGAGLSAEAEGRPGHGVFWTAQEIESLAPCAQSAELFCAYYGIDSQLRMGADQSSAQTVPVVPLIRHPLDRFCQQRSLDPLDVAALVAALRAKVTAQRRQRASPELDSTELLGWNAAAVSGLCHAALQLERWEWLEAAERALEALQGEFWRPEGLCHGRAGGQWYGPATLEDAALYLHGCLDLYHASGQGRWLLESGRVVTWALEQLRNADGTWRLTALSDAYCAARRPDPFDQAHPSGYGLWAEGLLRLHQIEGSPQWRELAQQILEDISPWLVKVPMGTLGVAMGTQRWHAQTQPVWVLHAPGLAEWRHLRCAAARAGTPLVPIWPVVHGAEGVLPDEPVEQVRCERCGPLGCLETREGMQAVQHLFEESIRAQRS